MKTFTLDTNCLIDVDEKRPSRNSVLRLLNAARQGIASVCLVASSASERQRSGEFLTGIHAFHQRVDSLGFGGIELLRPLMRWDIGFWDNGLWASDESIAREEAIFSTLFPSSPYHWADYAEMKGWRPEDQSGSIYNRWRNQILDAQAYWAHQFAERDVFVTSDRCFRKLNGHADFPRADVREPADAASLI